MIRVIVAAAKRARVKMGIGGGIAVAAHGYRRDTVDVDAFFHYEDRQKVVRALRQVASSYEIEPITNDHWIAVPPGAEPDERIDLMFATGDPEESAIEMAKVKKCRGVNAPVFSVVWLVVAKFLADRNSPIDWADIYTLYQRGAYDVSDVVKRLKQMGHKTDAANFPGFLKRIENLKSGDK
jgi:hypothetical protein